MIRLIGRRTASQQAPIYMVVLFLFGGLSVSAVLGDDHSFTGAMSALLTVGLMHVAVSWLKLRFIGFERIVDGTPIVVYRDGVWDEARLRQIGEDLGVEYRFDCEVRELGGDWRRRAGGTFLIRTDAGEEEFDYVVCNQDVLTAYPQLLGDAPAGTRLVEDFRRSRLDKLDPATSAFIMYLGVDREFPQLSHHNIFFSDNYPREFAQMFDERQPADEPTIYVAIHSKAEPERAPAGCENWFVLVNAPALTADGRVDWPALTASYGDRLLERLETRFGLTGLRSSIRVRQHFTPADFQSRYRANAGSLYGFASHGTWAAFQRPGLSVPGVPNLFFTGGSTHPGGGLPLVCLSGQMAADKILARQASR